MRHWAYFSTLTILLWLWPVAPAWAGLVLTIQDATVSEGGSGYVDVLVRGDSLTPDVFNTFGFQFQISTGGPTRLEFVNPQPQDYLNYSNYVLFGNSTDQITGTAVGNVSTKVVPSDAYSGGDSTFDSSDVSLTSSTTDLLVRLQVTTVTSLRPRAGDTFTINLIPPAGTGTTSDVTFFTHVDANGENDLAFTSTPGTVAVTASAVPEPSTLVMAVSGAALLTLTRWIRHRARCV